jgi:hypothetical protein
MFIPSKAFASSFVLLLYNQPQSRLLYYIFYILCLDLKLNIVIDFRLLYPTDDITADSVKYKTTILGKDNVLAKLIGSTNILNFTRTAHPALPLLLIVLLLLLFLWILFQLFASKKLKAFASHMGESETKISISTRILSVILHYFDIYFLYVCIIFSESITCMKQYSMYQRSSSESTLLYTDNLSLQASEGIQVQRLVCSLNPSISCRGIIHIYILMLSSILLLIGIYLKFISHRLLSHKPNPSFPMSKYGSIDNLHTALILTLLIFKTAMRAFPESNLASNKFYFATAAAMGAIDLCVQTLSSPFYERMANRLRYAEVLMTLVISLYFIITMALIDSVLMVSRQYPMLIAISLSFCILFRIADSMEGLFDRVTVFGINHRLANKRTLNFIYLGLKYIDACVDKDLRKLKSDEYQRILLFMLGQKEKQSNKSRYLRRNLEAGKLDNFAQKFDMKAFDIFTEMGTFVMSSAKDKSPQLQAFKSNVSKPEEKEISKQGTVIASAASLKESHLMEQRLEEDKATDKPSQSPLAPVDKKDITPSAKKGTGFNVNKFISMKSHVPSDVNFAEGISKAMAKEKNVPMPKKGVTPGESPNLAAEAYKEKFGGASAKMLKTMPGIIEVLKDNSFLIPGNRLQDILKEAKTIANAKSIVDNNQVAVETVEQKQERQLKDAQSQNDAKVLAKYFLLNSFEEGKNSNIHYPIKLIDDMLEDHMRMMFHNPSIDFKQIEEILNLYVDFKIEYLGNAYQVSIKIREFEKRFSKASKNISTTRNRFYFKILYAKIEQHIKHKLETGNLIFAKKREQLTFSSDQTNFMKLYDCARFINTYDDLKKEVTSICETKTNFMNDLLANGADFKEIFRLTNQFSRRQLRLESSFKQLINKSQGKFTPVMMIYGNYLYHIEQNLRKARKILRRYVLKKFFFDLRNICNIPLGKNEEMITVGCSMERETFHMINMVSCNCFPFLEYDAHELVGQDLNILIPKPLNQYHQNLMKPINLSGVLFERKTQTEISIVKKNGYLAIGQATFRMNYRVGSCLEVFAAIVFDKETYGLKNLMVVNEDMLISGLSEAATDYFEKDTFIFQYNKRFKSIFTSLNYFSNFRLKFNELSLDSLMEDDLILEHCRVYFNFLNGDQVEIIDKNGFKRPLFMKITINCLPTVSKYIQFVEFELNLLEELGVTSLDNANLSQSFSMFTVGTLGNPKERKFNYQLLDSHELRVKQLLDYLQNSTFFQFKNNSKKETDTANFVTLGATGFSGIEKQERESVNNKDRKNLDTTQELQNQFNNMVNPSHKYLKNIGASAVEDANNNNQLGQSEQMEYAKLIQDADAKKTFEKPSEVDNIGALPENLENIQKGFSAHLKFKAKDNRSEESIRMKSSQMRKVFKKDTVDHQYVIILNEKIKTLNSNIMLIILASYLVFSLCFQAFAGYYKYIIIEKIGIDVMDKIIAVDYNGKELNSTINFITAMDLNRMVWEGKLPDNLFAEEGVASIVAQNDNLKSFFKFKMSLYFWKSHLLIQNVSFPGQLANSDEDNSEKKIHLDFYKMHLNKFQTEILKLPSGYSYVQPLIDWYSTTSFVATPLPPLSTPSLDNVVEEVMRRNLGGELSASTVENGRRYRDYYRSLGRYYVNANLVCQLCALFSVLLVCMIILLYTVLLRFRFRYVYLTMFGFKVGSC